MFLAPFTLAVSMSHSHIGHVYDAWGSTPNNMGFLPTALAEAKIAETHVSLALKQSDNLKWLQTHTVHVRHALSGEGSGPGMGFGVLAGSKGVVKHIALAAQGSDASANVVLHAEHVASSANNAVSWAMEAISLCDVIASTNTASAATEHVTNLQKLINAIVMGMDANKDGNIGWQKGEGGLYMADKHMGFMMKGEGL